ncbi:sensor domain-containing diguanylate cyclase [Anoxybacteroides tepidamans]|uniref:sensor domain-containing diguanylate cyclase n=1 Tax=Anoxybacteroides tepidamans TaxID=265948 RepID=UPI000486E080|nr:sensor domain-containing diguanylate cyclase [Anoxybacillus tepidamans]
MKVEEQEAYTAFKEKFFDWLLLYEDYGHFSKMMLNLLLLLKQELMVREVTLFLFDPIKKTFYPEVTTREGDILSVEIQTTHPEKNIYVHDYGEYTSVQIFLRRSEEFIGVLQILYESHQQWSLSFFERIEKDFSRLLSKMKRISRGLSEEKRYERLHHFTAKIHASMKIEDVLEEIIETLREVYPSFTYYLFLSHDHQYHDHLPIKMLMFENDEENIGAMQAFLTGKIQLEDSIALQRSILYAPIKGAQGVYGVIEIIAPHIMEFPKSEMNFISLLANTAGSALENAKLYEQSRRLVADLQLINETMHRLNANLRLQDALEFMTEQIKLSFGAEEVGFFLFDSEKKKMLPGSTPFFQSRQAKKYIEFVSKRIRTERDMVFLGEAKIDASPPFPLFHSLMAVPMVQNGRLKGVVIVLHRQPYHFTFEMFKLLQSLIHHSTLAFTNAMLREELENLVVTDYLTKLYSRHYLDEQLQKSMERDAFGTFILIDIDNFKEINDTYGHQTGDDVIIQVANVIKQNIRESDIGARWGGEELAIYLPKVGLATGISIANRLATKVRNETNPPVTVSCGVSYWKKNRYEEATDLFKRADEALYMAKRSGKNCVFVKDYHHQYKA